MVSVSFFPRKDSGMLIERLYRALPVYVWRRESWVVTLEGGTGMPAPFVSRVPGREAIPVASAPEKRAVSGNSSRVYCQIPERSSFRRCPSCAQIEKTANENVRRERSLKGSRCRILLEMVVKFLVSRH